MLKIIIKLPKFVRNVFNMFKMAKMDMQNNYLYISLSFLKTNVRIDCGRVVKICISNV